MATTYRIYYRALQGRKVCNFNAPGIDADSSVVVVVSEHRPWRPDQVLDDTTAPNRDRFVGEANIWTSNISPHQEGAGHDSSGVAFVVNVDWDSPLDVVADVTILDPPVQRLGL